LKIDRERDCERGGADGEARRRRISLVDLRLRSNEASRPAPPQDRPSYFQNTLFGGPGLSTAVNRVGQCHGSMRILEEKGQIKPIIKTKL
jgi:hypothetical protein